MLRNLSRNDGTNHAHGQRIPSIVLESLIQTSKNGLIPLKRVETLRSVV